jgi:hypothetical protein
MDSYSSQSLFQNRIIIPSLLIFLVFRSVALMPPNSGGTKKGSDGATQKEWLFRGMRSVLVEPLLTGNGRNPFWTADPVPVLRKSESPLFVRLPLLKLHSLLPL